VKLSQSDTLRFVVKPYDGCYNWEVILFVNDRVWDSRRCDFFIKATKRRLLKVYKAQLRADDPGRKDIDICERHSGAVVIEKPKAKVSKKLKKLRKQVPAYVYRDQ